MTVPSLLPFWLSALAVFLLGWPARSVLRRLGVIDKPNARSSHAVPTVRGGGVAIILTVLGALAWQMVQVGTWGTRMAVLIVLGVSVLVLSVVSFVDDLRSVGARIRFGCHAAAAISVLSTRGLPPTESGGAVGMLLSVGLWLIGFLWIAGYTNAFNFMDGINGIAAGQAMITGLATAALAVAAGLGCEHPVVWLSLVTAGTGAGFLPHNFPRARMFMGDVSSAPLGLLLAVLGWWLACKSGWWVLFAVGLLHANFVLDTGVTLARRVLRGERWYEPHREHFYQRLVRGGRSHSFVTSWEMALQIVVGVMVVAATLAGGAWLAAAGVAVVALWAAFFVYAERVFKAASKA
jgi:UDP-N-acetylmuramyl pentapeptide phosphotransferase/UDP-N-acetylglucosamine-1-phosphate transferase